LENSFYLLFFRDYTYEKIDKIAKWLLERIEFKPKIGIVCGSGLGGLGDRLQSARIFPYESIPDFPNSTGMFQVLIIKKFLDRKKLLIKIYNNLFCK
jgi:purine nucleoside phosphorylase